jgi:hypothetical protein
MFSQPNPLFTRSFVTIDYARQKEEKFQIGSCRSCSKAVFDKEDNLIALNKSRIC